MSQSAGPTNILELVNNTVELPTLPETVARLGKVIDDPDSSVETVAAELSKDPAIATNLLRIANTAYYGLPVRVSSVNVAVSVLGFKMTRKLALKAAVFSVFGHRRERIQQFDPSAFWKHAVFTAMVARALGARSSCFEDTHPEDLYVAGLLHDIGKLVMLDRAASKYLACLRKAAQSQTPEVEVELEEFGFTHTDVGSMLAIQWSLPEDLAIAIRYHHSPSRDPFHCSLSSLMHLSDHLAWRVGKPSTVGTVAGAFDSDVYEQVGLSPDEVEAVLSSIVEDESSLETPW